MTSRIVMFVDRAAWGGSRHLIYTEEQLLPLTSSCYMMKPHTVSDVTLCQGRRRRSFVVELFTGWTQAHIVCTKYHHSCFPSFSPIFENNIFDTDIPQKVLSSFCCCLRDIGRKTSSVSLRGFKQGFLFYYDQIYGRQEALSLQNLLRKKF